MNVPHEPEAVLSKRLAEAAEQVTANADYMHYKQQLYTVLHLAIEEATNEICVVYRAKYGERLIFIRPVHDWLAEVRWEGRRVKRFARVE
jgi:hypothetical protein